MSGTDGGIGGGGTPPSAVHGFEVMAGTFDLAPNPSALWVDVPLEVTLPVAGTYQLDATVRGRVSNASSPVNVFIAARLFDVTAGAVVPNSEAMIIQQSVAVNPATTTVNTGANQNAPIVTQYTVAGSTTVRLQAKRQDNVGAALTADLWSDATNGRTSLRFERVGP